MSYSDEGTFIECINTIQKPIETLVDMFHSQRVQFNSVKWEIENKVAELAKIKEDLAMQKRMIDVIRKEADSIRAQAQNEKGNLVNSGLKYLSECQMILEKGK